MFVWLVVLLLLFLLGGSVYAAHFFIHAALFKNDRWYDKTGHKMMNPDNFAKDLSIYDQTEIQQKKQGETFWEASFAADHWLTDDDDRLYSRMFISHPQSHRWVLCVHGYRSNGKRDMAYVASQFSDEGYNVLVPDLRAHGRSSGTVIGMGWLDRLDLLQWIQEILAFDREAEIILFGGSMGAASVMMVSGENLPQNVKGLIADCGYTSVYGEFQTMLRSAFKLPAFPIMTLANWLAKLRVGYSLKEASSIKQLKKNTLPILFIHGTGDKFVPHQMIYQNMEATAGVKESLLIEGAPHLSSFVYEPEHYFGTVFEFLQRYC